VTVLDRALRLLHPVVPFVTAALWERLPWPEGEDRPDDLMVAPWPVADEAWRDAEAEARLQTLQELITTVRSLRKEYGIAEGQGVTLEVATDDQAVRDVLVDRRVTLERLARISALGVVPASGRVAAHGGTVGAHAVLRAGAELFLPLEGVVDVERERQRLGGEIERLGAQLAGAEVRLANEQFVFRAPDDVVQRERERARGLEEQLAKLREKLALFQGGA
jgi:valyl-tRNA synthetase